MSPPAGGGSSGGGGGAAAIARPGPISSRQKSVFEPGEIKMNQAQREIEQSGASTATASTATARNSTSATSSSNKNGASSSSSTGINRKPLRRKNPSRQKSSEKPIVERRKSYYQNPEEFADREFPLVYKPKVIKKIGDSCFIFHCTVKGNTGARFNKNMAVLVDDTTHHTHHHAEGSNNNHNEPIISIVNPLRLTEDGELKLLEIAATAGASTVHNIIRLGPSEHAAFEDDYYLTRFENCQRWAPGPFSCSPHLPLHHRLWDTTNSRTLSLDAPINPVSPHPSLQVFVFEETVEPESILYLSTKRTIIVGDCLQHQLDNPYVNEGGNDNLRKNGLLEGKVVLSSTWVSSQSVVSNNSRKLNNSFKTRAQKAKSFFSTLGTGKLKLRNDFQRLLKLDIDRITSTSGNDVLQSHSKTGISVRKEITNAVDRVCNGGGSE